MDIIDQPKDLPMAPRAPLPPSYEEIIAAQDQQHQRRDNSSIIAPNTSALEIATPDPGAVDHRELEEPICCCGFKIRTGVRVIGIIDVIRLIIALAWLIWRASYLSAYKDMFMIIVLMVMASFIAIYTVVLAMLFYGIWAERSGYLVPYMIMQVIGVIGNVLMFVGFVYGMSGVGFLSTLVGALTGIYFFFQVKRCRQFLDLKSQRRQILIGA